MNDTLADLRAALVRIHFDLHEAAARYCDRIADGTATQAEDDAHRALTTAGDYAYVIAAILQQAAETKDADHARQLAHIAQGLLEEGDLAGWNEDVMPGDLDERALRMGIKDGPLRKALQLHVGRKTPLAHSAVTA